MKKMGAYCKAYPIQRLREFSGWTENAQNARSERTEIDGKQVEEPRALTEDDFLYLQDNYTVTDGIFKDENVIFDDVTPQWLDFCRDVLKFEIPEIQKEPGSLNESNGNGSAEVSVNGSAVAP
jgi:hypothetical protein